MGRLALLSDNKTKVKLAHDAREEAVMALALEPSNDLAHHLMGRWHYEMANLNVVVRTLVRVMYGTALASGTLVPECSVRRSVVKCIVCPCNSCCCDSTLRWLEHSQTMRGGCTNNGEFSVYSSSSTYLQSYLVCFTVAATR